MKSQSKKGVALVYAIITAILLMLLVAALVAAATFNLRQSRTSLTSRQAYLDAKSAMNYSRAYLKLYAGQEQKMAVKGYKLTSINNPASFVRYTVAASLSGNVGSVASDQLKSFTVKCKEDESQQVIFTASDTGGTFKARAPYHYNGITASTDAAAAGRSSVLTFKLGKAYYTPVVKPKSSAGSIDDFLITAGSYGNTTIFANTYENSPSFQKDITVAYTLVCENTWQQISDYSAYSEAPDHVPTLTAPEAYFMCNQNVDSSGQKGDAARFWSQSYARVKSSFVCFNGNLYGRDDRTGYATYEDAVKDTANSQYSRLFLSTEDDGDGVVRFMRDCDITVDRDKQSDTKDLQPRKIRIPKGYYKFKSGANLLNLMQKGNNQKVFYDLSNDSSALLTRIPDADVAKTVKPDLVKRSDRIEYVYDNESKPSGQNATFRSRFLQGSDSDGCAYNYSTGWCKKGDSLGSGIPSSCWSAPRGQNEEYVYWHVNSTDNWKQAFANFDPLNRCTNEYGVDIKKEFPNIGINPNGQTYYDNFGLYTCKEMYLNYINPKDDFAVPAGCTVVFQSQKIWINSAKQDGAVGGGPALAGMDEGSHLYIMQKYHSSGDVALTVPADLTVKYYTEGDNQHAYTITAGTYSVPNKTDLFSEAAEKLLSDSSHQIPDKSADTVSTVSTASSAAGTSSGSTTTIDPDGGGYYVEN